MLFSIASFHEFFLLSISDTQKNTGQNGGKPKLDLNVEAAWAQGITGKNVTTAIMDDGVDYMHPDLKFNYVRFYRPLSDLKELLKIPIITLSFLTPFHFRMQRLAMILAAMTHTLIPGTQTIGLTG